MHCLVCNYYVSVFCTLKLLFARAYFSSIINILIKFSTWKHTFVPGCLIILNLIHFEVSLQVNVLIIIVHINQILFNCILFMTILLINIYH